MAVDDDIVGSGDDVALLHARPFVRWYEPLLAALPGHRVLRYRRTVPAGHHGFSLGDDAEVCARLLATSASTIPTWSITPTAGASRWRWPAAGTSRRALAVLEPATTGLSDPDEAAGATAPLIERDRSDGPETAIARLLRLILGDDARALLDAPLPGAFEDAVAHSEQLFAVELPALVRWPFGPDDPASIDQPIHSVLAPRATPASRERPRSSWPCSPGPRTTRCPAPVTW